MNRSRRDVWPPYTPTRHVLIKRQDYRYARPWQGFVLDWRRNKKEWVALVIFVDDTQDDLPVIQRWFPAGQLRPCRTDPNQPRDPAY